MTLPNVDSLPVRVTSRRSRPSRLIAPPNTCTPTLASNGTDSPVIGAVSRLAWPDNTTPSAGTRSPARTSTISPVFNVPLSTSVMLPSACTRRAWLRVSLPRAWIASWEPITLRSSSTCPKIMMIGSNAAVSRSPVAQAPSMARAINWSVMPCRLGKRRLYQAERITGTATNRDATPSSSWLTPLWSGASQRHTRPSTSKPRASIAKVNCRAALRCSAEVSMGALIVRLPG